MDRKNEEKAKLAGLGLKEVVYPESLAASPWTLAQCTKALWEMAERSEWDRADRYVNDLWPPGTEFATLKELQRRERRGAEAADEEIIEASRRLEQGGPDAGASGGLLTYVWLRATAARRAHYMKLGVRPEIASLLDLWSSRLGAFLASRSRKP